MRTWRLALAATCLLVASPAAVHAGGYDTPILYTARHMGMGGTAIGGVDDPSAIFHNPAGMAGVDGLGLLADISFLTGTLRSTGGYANTARATNESEPIVAPLFMLAGAYRLADDLHVGLAVYPVASGAAEYRTEFVGLPVIDKTRLVFFEVSPAASYVLPGGDVSLGLGYRVTYATLERLQGFEDDPNILNFEVTGLNYAGIRAGIQWRPSNAASLGIVYRHRIDVDLEADNGLAVANVRNARTTLTLPSKLGFGGRWDLGPLGFAADIELGFNSQNETSTISGDNADGVEVDGKPKREAVDNVFQWHDSITARLGIEYHVAPAWPVRVGYVFDGQVTNRAYPSAFGTPPAPSHSMTMGGGYEGDGWQVNLALARRTVSTTVAEDEIGQDPPCAFCAPAGEFELELYGVYVDYSIELGGDAAN